MSKKDFCSLHTHTAYSALDGMSKIPELVSRAKELGMSSLGISDHGALHGIVEFYRECKKQEVKPVLGIEAYFAEDRTVKSGVKVKNGGDLDGSDKRYYHLSVYAENQDGYQNLLKLSSDAYINGMYYKPRCLLAGQPIVTRGGVKPIEDIVVGDVVLTHKGRWRPVKEVMVNHYEGDIFGIKLNKQYGNITWLTEGHPILIRDNAGGLQWVNSEDVLAGRPSSAQRVDNWNSWVCLPKVIRENEISSVRVEGYSDWGFCGDGVFTKQTARSNMGPTNHYVQFPEEIELDYAFGKYLGLYLAEGWVSKGEIAFSFHEDEVEFQHFVKDFYEDLSGRVAVIDPLTYKGENYHGVMVRCAHSLFSQFLKNNCGTHAYNKRIPEWAWDAPDSFQKGLLDGILGGDASLKSSVTIFTQTSQNLAWQVRMLEAKFSASFTCVKEYWDGNDNHKPQYRQNISKGSQNLTYRSTIDDDNYVYKPIADVEVKHFCGTTYNIEVEEDHSYVSDFVMHNCDYETLGQFNKGLIVGSGCLGGPVLQPLLHGDYRGALHAATRLQDIVGKDNFFVELMNHGLPEQDRTNPQLLQLAKEIGAKAYVSQDCHYVHQHDHEGHDSLLCVNTGSTVSQQDRFKFHNDQYYLKSPDEMYALFPSNAELCTNTLLIAERCNVEIDFDSMHLPEFPLPDGFHTASEYLAHLTWENFAKFYPDASQEVIDRVAYELSVFDSMGVSSYMLIFWDLANFARRERIMTGPGRGSAAGSCVSYILGVTKVDPIEYGLVFERFLNPSRIALPDIDWDIMRDAREKVINYTIETYGKDHVAQIATVSRIHGRSAIRDAARVLEYPPSAGDRLSKMMPKPVSGFLTSLTECFEESPKNRDGYAAAADLREDYQNNSDTQRIIDLARKLEGLVRTYGAHAAGVLIGDRPLDELVPLFLTKDGAITAQWDKRIVEDLGLVKMDYLGLKNLDIIRMTETLVGGDFDIENVPMDDTETFSLLRAGETVGVFQVESAGMISLLKSLRPDNILDISAVLALFRPGPMAQNWHNEYADRKNGRKPAEPFHEDAREILKDTYYLAPYQEQVMKLSEKFAGYTLPEADNLRKIMGKKLPEAMAAEKDKFVSGCVAQGYELEFSEELFHMIEGFSAYGFNKAHSVSYAFITYWTAFLKTHYPREYMASLLTFSMGDLDATARYIGEARRMGLQIYPPHVNNPSINYIVEDDGIRIGLVSLKHVGESIVAHIIDERSQGEFSDIHDFCRRVNPNKGVLTVLANTGSLAGWGSRRGIVAVADEILTSVRKDAKKNSGNGSLFDVSDFIDLHIPAEEYSHKHLLDLEKEYMGIYASGHPLDDAEWGGQTIGFCVEAEEGQKASILGVVTELEVKTTKTGARMATVILEDLTGAIKVTVFPKTWGEVSEAFRVGNIVEATLRVGWDGFRDVKNFVLLGAVEQMDDNLNIDTSQFFGLHLPLGFRNNPTAMSRLKGILLEERGRVPVRIYISRSTKLDGFDKYAVNCSSNLKEKVKALFRDYK